MDFHALQHKLFNLEPSNPLEDKQKMIAVAQGNLQKSAEPTKDYVQESVEVPQGSMPLVIDDLSDFAKLAGVTINETQKMGPAGQAKGKDPMPSTSKPSTSGEQPHPLKDKLVGEHEINPVSDDTEVGDIDKALGKFGADMGLKGPYLSAWQKFAFDAFMKIMFRQHSTTRAALPRKANERTLTKGEETKKEKYVKGMKKNKSDFKDRYGKDAEAVMYATATKNAKKNESIKDQLYKALNDYK